MTESLALEIARDRLQSYEATGNSLMREHREAMDCRDCEAFLQTGIDAFRWLVRADESIRSGFFQGLTEYDPNIDTILQELFQAWLEPCDRAEVWIALQISRGYAVENLDEFQQCCNEARAIVESFQSAAYEELPDRMARLQDEAFAEHQDGKTLEFMESD